MLRGVKRSLYLSNSSDSLDNEFINSLQQNDFQSEITKYALAGSTDFFDNRCNFEKISQEIEIVIIRGDGRCLNQINSIVRRIRSISSRVFICIALSTASSDPVARYELFKGGASMVSSSVSDITNVVKKISEISNQNGPYKCPICKKAGLSEDGLWQHCPLYHINEKKEDIVCPICEHVSRGPFQVHMHNCHGPPGRGQMQSEFRIPETKLYAFALVVCRHPTTGKFLLVQEFANSGYWLPGGRIDPGEDPKQAAIRETKEEAGIDIQLTGFIRLEYFPKYDSKGDSYIRMRFIFTAIPCVEDAIPKSIPDYESVGATWTSTEELDKLQLRGSEPKIYFKYIEDGHDIYPLCSIASVYNSSK